jgi:hypothetical protein
MPHVPDASSDIEVFDPSAVQPSSDNEDIDYGSIGSDSDDNEGNSHSSEDEGGSQQAIRSNGQAWEVQNNTVIAVETELDTHSHLSDSSRATTPGITSQDTLSTQSPPFRTRSQRQTILDNLNPPTTRTNSIETMFGSNILDYKMAVQVLQKELEHTRAQRDAAETHAVYAQREAAVWKHKFNKKKDKIKDPSRRIHTSSRITTNEQGLKEVEEERQKKQEKMQRESEKQLQKEAKRKADIVHRATQGSSRIFSGSLSSKNKTELEDVADALSLSLEGTKVTLIARISAYFDEHPRFKEDQRFSGLFERSRGRKRAPHDENAIAGLGPDSQCPAQRRRISPQPSLQPITNVSPYPMIPSLATHTHTLPMIATSSQVRLEDFWAQEMRDPVYFNVFHS